MSRYLIPVYSFSCLTVPEKEIIKQENKNTIFILNPEKNYKNR